MDDPTELSDLARRHLWMHFSRLGSYGADHPVHGHRARRGLLGRGRHRATAASTASRVCSPCRSATAAPTSPPRRRVQAETLEYFPIWTYAHPPAIELAARLAELAPGDLNRVFFTSGGSESVESAWKLARQYFRAIGRGSAPQGDRAPRPRTTAPRSARSRSPASRRCARRSSRSRPARVHVANTDRVPATRSRDDEKAFMLAVTDEIEERDPVRGPGDRRRGVPRAGAERGRLLHAARGLLRAVREICDRYGVLLVSDEVICAFGRLGHMFGARALRLPPRHHHLRQGAHQRLLAARRGDVPRLPRRAVPRASTASFAHGLTFGGHPVSCAVALANLDVVRSRRRARQRASRTRTRLRRAARGPLRDLPIVGDLRGAGYFWALELVKDRRHDGAVHRARSPTSCCAASSLPGSTSSASSPAPTTACARSCSSRHRSSRAPTSSR